MSTSKDVQGLLLEDLWDLCYRAHSHISFSPEKRATHYVKTYSKELEDDLELLGDNKGNYKEKYISKFKDWMHAKGNCISSMITGPANFPVRRAQKANQSEYNRMMDFVNWREKYFKAVNRVPTKSPEDELTIAENRLVKLVELQDFYKQLNKDVRASHLESTTNIGELADYLKSLGYSLKEIRELDYRGGKWRVPAFRLTNNNNTIKRTEEKVKIMLARIDRKTNWEDIMFDGGYVTIEDDRLKILHDEKPSKEIITEIKSNGFRWSPHWKCWCRKHTGNAIYALKQLSFINNTGL